MNQWITFQWPRYRDPRRQYPPRLWLEDADCGMRHLFTPGDTVLIYELGNGPAIVAENGQALPKMVRCEHGKQGITGIWRLKEAVSQHVDFPRRLYNTDREMWWCWYGDLEPVDTGGFVDRQRALHILGYSAQYTLHGLRLRELNSAEADALRTAYLSSYRR